MEAHSEREVNIHPMKNTKQIIRRALTAALASAMLVSSMAGCAPKQSTSSKGDASSTAPASSAGESKTEFDAKAITNGKKLTLLVKENVKISDYSTNEMTKDVENAMGVQLEFVVLPAADYESKINVMVQGGDTLPDVISRPGSNMYSWAKSGALAPLKKYYDDENYSAHLRKACEETNTDIATYLTQPDGEIYGLPGWTQSYNGETWKKFWVYKPWLDQLGLKMPETTDEFYEVCKKIVESDPNGNGKKDEVAISASGIGYLGTWFAGLMTPFVYAYDDEYRVLDNGTISFAYTTDEWKEGLKYVKKFFDDKLISTEIFTQDSKQYSAGLNSDEQTVFAINYWNCDQINADLMDRKLGYTYINALKGPSGKAEGFYSPSLPFVNASITSDCKDPDAAFLVLDYMCNPEFGISQRYGQQGVDWDYVDEAKNFNKADYQPTVPGFDMSIIAYDDAAFWGGSNVQNRSWLNEVSYVLPMKVINGVAVNVASTDESDVQKRQYAQVYAESTVHGHEVARKEVVSYLPLTKEESDSIAEQKTSLKSYLTEMIAAFCTGAKDIDKDWDSYLAELEKIGYKNILQVYQTAYDRLYK